MALVDKLRCVFLSSLLIAAVASCGEQATPRAAFKQAPAPGLSSPKGGDPVGALPSQVVSGEVAAFDATSTHRGARKDRDAAGSLPSISAAGKSAVYAPGDGRAPSASTAAPAGVAR